MNEADAWRSIRASLASQAVVAALASVPVQHRMEFGMWLQRLGTSVADEPPPQPSARITQFARR